MAGVRGLGTPPERYSEAARAVTERLIAEYPDLMERYGERGRAFGVHDTSYQIAWIVNAVDLGSADLLRRDLLWLREVLRSREFPMDVLRRNFELSIEACAQTGLADHDQLQRIAIPLLDELR